jgi:hypothetical protein
MLVINPSRRQVIFKSHVVISALFLQNPSARLLTTLFSRNQNYSQLPSHTHTVICGSYSLQTRNFQALGGPC